MWNGYLGFFVVNDSLDNDAENQSLFRLLCTNNAQTFSMGNSHTVYQGETLAVDSGIQKLSLCIQQTLFRL